MNRYATEDLWIADRQPGFKTLSTAKMRPEEIRWYRVIG
jgi:hypothetical protein